jgi:hypothetical protein
MTETLSIRAYARHRGCTPAAVRKAIKRLDIPQDPDGKVHVAEADRLWPWLSDRSAGTTAGTEGEPSAPTYAEAKRRKELAVAEMRELELERMRGNLISLDYLDQQLSGCLMGVRGVLLSMPGKWAPALVGVATVARAQLVLQEAIDEAMPTLQAIGTDPSLDEDDWTDNRPRAV